MVVGCRWIDMGVSACGTDTVLPRLALHLTSELKPSSGIGVLVINYNTAFQTLRCLKSLRESTLQPDWVFVLDNASASDDYLHLLIGCERPTFGELRLYKSVKNLGFAQGSNVLIDLLLGEPRCKEVMLLNNDAVAQADMLETLSLALFKSGSNAGLAGGRMHKLADPSEVDTLGISLYASLMPADRKTLEDPWLGPTGGCCLMSRQMLQTLHRTTGYYFDARYFCYCEDTDLVIRGVLSGFEPVYVNSLVALHEGQASSGGGHSDFISYHGIRTRFGCMRS